MSVRKDCPGCGALHRGNVFRLRDQPVVLNYRFPDAAAARDVPRRDIALVQCRVCGLTFNAAFDPSVIPYDARYENRQNASPAFVAHLEELAGELGRKYSLEDRWVLEVGCGKGDFLRLFSRQTGCRAIGYDTTFEGDPGTPRSRVQFQQRYVTAADVRREYRMILCRHVVEHVGEIGAFLAELRTIAVPAGNPVVVLETPAFEWIIEHRCLWDVFYEHCNYFTMASLAHLCRKAGFAIRSQRAVFGGQYQVIEMVCARRPKVPRSRPIPPAESLKAFAASARKTRGAIVSAIRKAAGTKKWAIWGAGAKGVALVNLLPERPPAFVIDSNPAKRGCAIPGSGVEIVAPSDPRVGEVAAILVANPNYRSEIQADLAARGHHGQLFSLEA